MISEKQFIFNFNFFWNSLLPTSSLFLTRINEDLYERHFDYLQSPITGRRRSFISFISFQLFTLASKQKIQLIDYQYDHYKLIEGQFIKQFLELEEDDTELTSPLALQEYLEALSLANRLQAYFSKISNGNPLITNPLFKGCGFLNNCIGDVIVNETLYEIKMVNRNFRISDCKQILTYCALNYVSKQYKLNKVSLFNPRSGKLTIFNIDDFCLTLSGKPSTFLFGEIIEFVSGGGISR